MFDIKDKSKNIRQLNNYMLAKTLGMFSYRGLPDTIPARELELMLQRYGYAFYTEIEGTPYVFWGGLGGLPDVYGQPTQININNPALEYNATLDIEKDGVLIQNDSMKMGLFPLLERMHTLMVENQISMDMLSFNSRTLQLLSASDDKTKESAELFLKKLKDGNPAVIGDNAMFDGVKVHSANSSGSSRFTDLIEYHQYLKATLYQEIGLSEPSNMKRERLNSREIEQQEGSTQAYVDNMLYCRKDALQRIEQKFGRRIKVNFSGVWREKNEGSSKENSDNRPIASR